MENIKVYENVKEMQKAVNTGKIKRGQEVYCFNEKPKIKKSITLYRLIKDKYTKELCFTNY